MDDITVQMIRETLSKNMFVREAMIGGVLAGMAVQRELVMSGKNTFDGALVAMIQANADKELPVVIRELGTQYERLLSAGLFVGWDEKKDYQKEYFIYFGKGMIYVCKLYQELTTANIGWPEIMAKVSLVVDSRSAELRKMM